MARFMVLTAALAALCCGAARPGAAATVGNAPWCAVINLGDGDVEWDCEYNSVEACVPNVLAGNRGFCNVNPYGPPPQTAVVAHDKRRARHHDGPPS